MTTIQHIQHLTKTFKCSYCKSSNHTIKHCTIDNDLFQKLVANADTIPDFNSMSCRILKKLSFLSGNKVSLSKTALVNGLKLAWECSKRNKKNMDDQTTCPVCFDHLSFKNICVTKCNHKFCLECILTHHTKNNNCPLCRTQLCTATKISNFSFNSSNSNGTTFSRLWRNYNEYEHEYGLGVNTGPSEVDDDGMTWDAVWISYNAVRRPNHTRTFDLDFETNRLMRQMDCYDDFGTFYDSHFSFDISTPIPFTDSDSEIINEDWHYHLLSLWQLVNPERVPLEVTQPNFNIQNFIMDIRNNEDRYSDHNYY